MKPGFQPGVDREFLRSSSNRRVRKVRVARMLLHISALAAVNAAVAGLLIYSGYLAANGVLHTRRLAVSRIEIVGAERAPQDSLQAALARFVGRNLLSLNLDRVAEAALREPWVRSASVKRVLPDRLRVAVTERQPAAVALIGGLAHLVDDTGFVIGPVGPGREDDLPVLLGLDGLKGDRLAAALRRGVGAVLRLREAGGGWARRVSSLDLSHSDRIVLETVNPGPRILLDPHRVERNLAAYREMESRIARRVGPLEYVDLRWEGRITVMPAEPLFISENR